MITLQERRINAARRAIDAAGGPIKLAERLSNYLGGYIRTDLVRSWLARGIPEDWTTTIEHVTGVPRHEINPQMYEVKTED